MNQAILNDLGKHIAEKILKQPHRIIRPDEPLISSGLVDSFSLVDLALYIEDTYNTRIDDTELNKDTFDTLEQLTNLIEQRRPG
jgi:acyl carrier protein